MEQIHTRWSTQELNLLKGNKYKGNQEVEEQSLESSDRNDTLHVKHSLKLTKRKAELTLSFWQRVSIFFQAGEHGPALCKETREQRVLLQLINSATSRPAGRGPVHLRSKAPCTSIHHLSPQKRCTVRPCSHKPFAKYKDYSSEKLKERS